jgi:anti-anti-sigma regulatory factor
MTCAGTLKVGRTPTGYRLRIEGRGTMRESPAVQSLAIQALDAPGGTFVVDLSACDYLDSTFMGCLAGLAKRYGPGGTATTPRVRLLRPSPPCRRLLASSHLDLLLELSDEEPTLLGDDLAIPIENLSPEELGRHVLDCHRRLVELSERNATVFGPVVERLEQDLARRAETTAEG